MRILCLIIACLGLAVLGIEIINDFSKTKTFYASLHPKEFFYGDTLIVDLSLPPSGTSSSSNKVSWIFNGYCKSDNSRNSISISKTVVENEEEYFDTKKIPIWRNKLAKEEIIRNKGKIDKPFSYPMLDYWFSCLLIFLIVPSFLYYLIATIKKNRR